MFLSDPIGTAEAAKLAGIKKTNFRHFILRGETPPFIRVGRTTLFERNDILNWEAPKKKIGRPKKSKPSTKKEPKP